MKNRIVNVLFAGTVALVLVLPLQAKAKLEKTKQASEYSKLGYVDIKKVVQETKVGKKATASLEKWVKQKKKNLSQMEEELKKMNTDLEKKNLILSEEVMDKKRQTLRAKMIKYQEEVNKSQMELQKKEGDLITPIYEEINSIVGRIGEEGNYTMILERGNSFILWAKKSIDLTNRVIKEIDKNKKRKKKK